MIKVISSPSMLISNFILFNCIVIIFSIFSFFFTVLYLTILLFTTNFKLFNCVVIIFSIFSFNTFFTDFTWQNYFIVLLFLFSYSIVFSEIYSWQLFIVHHKFQIIFVLLLFFCIFLFYTLFTEFHRFKADNKIMYCSPQISNNLITLLLFSYSILFSQPQISNYFIVLILFSLFSYLIFFSQIYIWQYSYRLWRVKCNYLVYFIWKHTLKKKRMW